jgi:hypothetical protein
MTKRFFALLQFKMRCSHRNSEIELVDRSYCYQYRQKIFLSYLVEGQVSRSDERYLSYKWFKTNISRDILD